MRAVKLKLMLVSCFVLPAVLLAGCPPKPVSPPPPDADSSPGSDDSYVPEELDGYSPAKTCAAFCKALDHAGCPEAHPETSTCENFCLTIHYEKQITDLHPTCVARATDAVGVRACGPQVKCAKGAL